MDASTEPVPHHHTVSTRETSTCQEPLGTKTSAWNALAQPLQTLTVNIPANVPVSSAVNAAQDTPTYQYQENAAEIAYQSLATTTESNTQSDRLGLQMLITAPLVNVL